MRNTTEQVFLQAMILRASGKLEIYDPLVIDQGTTPAIPPVPITIGAGDVVGIFGGGNNDTTRLIGDGSLSCVNGADGALFGQVFFCHTRTLFNAIIAAHVHIPMLGNDSSGDTCPSVRSFKLVDQDPSDNVTTHYLVTSDGRVAQDNAENRASLDGFSIASNGSDNTLLSRFVDPALGCSSWLIPDASDGGLLVPAQAANELQASSFQAAPVALVPAGDPMTGPNNLDLLNAYRLHVDQPSVNMLTDASTHRYCRHMREIAPPFFALHRKEFLASPSPMVGTNLFDFLQQRFAASLQLLDCPGA